MQYEYESEREPRSILQVPLLIAIARLNGIDHPYGMA
jgi:hypothetical protein